MTTSKRIEAAVLDAQFAAVCERAGVREEALMPHVKARMVLLAEFTATFDDGVRAMDMAEKVFQCRELRFSPFSEGDKNIVRTGCLFSDIGKTGPLRARLEQQRLIAQMFAVEGVRNDRMLVAEFFATYFSSDIERCLQLFHELGLDSAMPIRAFWNLHSQWTYELLKNSGVPAEAIPAAAAHHLLEHINPESMVADDGSFTQSFGANLAFDKPEKLVILLDKYDALRRRAQREHAAAIAWLRSLLATHTRFAHDVEFTSLLDVMDRVFANSTDERYA